VKDTKLLKALSTLDKAEWMSFRKHVLMNTGSDSELYSLFALLQSRKFNYEGLNSPDYFRKKYFPSVSQKAFFGMLSKLYKWLEDWFAINEMKNSEYDKELYLIKALSRKGLVKESKSHSHKLVRKLEESDGLDFKVNKTLSELCHVRYYNVSVDSAEERHELLLTASRKNAEYYKDISQFYIAEFSNRGSIYNQDFSEIKEMLSASGELIDPSKISKYGKTINEVIQNGGVEKLEILKNSILAGEFKSGSELEELVNDYVRIYIRKLFVNNVADNVDSFYPLYNFRMRKLMGESNKKITTVNFHNIIDEIANLISVEKAKDFLETWIDYVETIKQKETKDLAYSQIYFIKRDFNKMSEYSQNISFDNYGQRTRAWLHNVICQYKYRHENYQQAIQSMSAFKNYLKRNKNKYSKNFLTANLNTVTLMEKIAKNDFKEMDINIEDYKLLFYRLFMTEEVQKLKRK